MLGASRRFQESLEVEYFHWHYIPTLPLDTIVKRCVTWYFCLKLTLVLMGHHLLLLTVKVDAGSGFIAQPGTVNEHNSVPE